MVYMTFSKKLFLYDEFLLLVQSPVDGGKGSASRSP